MNQLNHYFDEMNEEKYNKLDYLRLLAKEFPTPTKAASEIINLQAILSLPKGTEHFLSDVHGEYESFVHVLKNASGVIRTKIDDLFKNTLLEKERKSLATLVYYPKEKLEIIKQEQEDLEQWYHVTLYRLIELARYSASKYTRSKVRKQLNDEFAYIMEEMLHEQEHLDNKKEYFDRIITTMIEIDQADDFIIALCELIQKLVVDHLHILGDIYDRGPRPDIIMDTLMNYHSVDIQWGNHDILWMGAASGSEACICNCLRISLRYGNLQFVEDAYGINLLPLALFANKYYADDDCQRFYPKSCDEFNDESELPLIAKMCKAISIIQFKCEAMIIDRHPEYEMEHYKLMHRMNQEKNKITIDGQTYDLLDHHFPTVDIAHPYELNDDEKNLLKRLKSSFLHSEKLQRHVNFLFEKGRIYLNYNNNLLFHGCIPLEDDLTFKKMEFDGIPLKGKALLKKFESLAFLGYYSEVKEVKQIGLDMMWYLWCGPTSSCYGKKKMATFERLFIADKKLHKEPYNAYYDHREDEKMCQMILEEFNLDKETSIIINGHIPVKGKDGESPIKGHGRMIVIDGGFSKAYQLQTGIAGYTLIYNSHGLQLISHNHFESRQMAIEKETDINSTKSVVSISKQRLLVEDTDIGKELKNQIFNLKLLLAAYHKKKIK